MQTPAPCPSLGSKLTLHGQSLTENNRLTKCQGKKDFFSVLVNMTVKVSQPLSTVCVPTYLWHTERSSSSVLVTITQSTRLRSISEWRTLLNNNDPFQLQA